MTQHPPGVVQAGVCGAFRRRRFRDRGGRGGPAACEVRPAALRRWRRRQQQTVTAWWVARGALWARARLRKVLYLGFCTRVCQITVGPPRMACGVEARLVCGKGRKQDLRRITFMNDRLGASITIPQAVVVGRVVERATGGRDYRRPAGGGRPCTTRAEQEGLATVIRAHRHPSRPCRRRCSHPRLQAATP